VKQTTKKITNLGISAIEGISEAVEEKEKKRAKRQQMHWAL